MGFISITNAIAEGLTRTILKQLEFSDVNKIRGQGYDGASVMSGARGGVQTLMGRYFKTSDINAPVPYVHCASHNLLINDAVQSSAISVGFFGTRAEIFNFFGQSINRWAQLAFTEASITKLKLKRLRPTRIVLQKRCN